MADLARRALLAAPLLIAAAPASETTFDLRLTALEGGELDLAAFRGRPTLVATNTASFCGFTARYAGLQRLHERFGPRGLAVIGVPSNDFNQEAADASRIRSSCEMTFGIDFPPAGLTRVSGPRAHPSFALATRWPRVERAARPAGTPPST